MQVIVLQSGSNGNAVYVESNGTRVLLDAGITGRQAQLRLQTFGREITDVDGVVISHDHADHARYLGVYQRKFALPVHVTAATLKAAGRHCQLGALRDVRPFRAGQTLRFDGLAVHTVPTPHDGVDGVAFVVEDGSSRLGVLTDLGHVYDQLHEVVASLDALLIESNYDPRLLDEGYYPEFLKHRIRGPGGHLSNLEAAALIADAADSRLRWVCLGHLSEDNNRPEIALSAHRGLLGDQVPIHVASRYEPTGVFEV